MEKQKTRSSDPALLGLARGFFLTPCIGDSRLTRRLPRLLPNHSLWVMPISSRQNISHIFTDTLLHGHSLCNSPTLRERTKDCWYHRSHPEKHFVWMENFSVNDLIGQMADVILLMFSRLSGSVWIYCKKLLFL